MNWFYLTLINVILVKIFFTLYKYYCCRKKKHVFGILHPDNLGGGGGERVLWCLVKGIQEKYPESHLVIYSNHSESFSVIKKKVMNSFNINLMEKPKIQIINIKYFKKLVDFAGNLPFTLLFQSLSSIVMGFFALLKFTPHVFIETTGYAFTYPFAKIFCGCKVVSYTHYPTISTVFIFFEITFLRIC